MHRRSRAENVPLEVRKRRKEAANTEDPENLSELPKGTKKMCAKCKNDNKSKYYCKKCHIFCA
ncbi:hypothetical protein NQ314_014842 [Rhamnusium bicolor]|uniref:PiggyBac transposable element-derived protein 4 C-terminal zinc-ribbon domain-containing protein n=1 Tax=Rhamnusium bicolor TaxID=1586634 RepID=A0AAV8X0I6_9CUCU|nr:hypothetical protein NQ314_014842 [Rhamnusium bicolor]